MLRPSAPRARTIPSLLGALLIVCLCYQAYRYPFQINSAQTSPTYQDTPVWLQVGKWVLIALLIGVLALTTLPQFADTLRTATRTRLVALGLELLLLVLAALPVIAGTSSVEPKVMLLMIGTAVVITLAPGIDHHLGRAAARIVIGFSILCIVVEIVQVVLFLLLGRLPALAYAGSPSVRFGAVLDDPNGFAVLLAALIPTTWFALRSRPSARIVIVVALACCLPLTQSWTGAAVTPAAIGLSWACCQGLRRDWRRAGAVALSTATVVGASLFFARSTVAELVSLKRGSVDDHAASLDQLAPDPPAAAAASSGVEPVASGAPVASADPAASAETLTPPAPVASASHPPDQLHSAVASWVPSIESGYVNLFVNYGPVFLIGFVALGIIAAVLLLRGRSRLPLALRVGGASYLIAYLLATANLALDRTFPCNVLYLVVCGIALASTGRRSSRKGHEALARASAATDHTRTR